MRQRPNKWQLLKGGPNGKILLRVKDIDWVTVESNDPVAHFSKVPKKFGSQKAAAKAQTL